MKIITKLLDENARLPKRYHYDDTGADVYLPCNVMIQPHSTVTIGLGISIDIPYGVTARLQGRTSISKQGLLVHQCAIDAGYKGELHVIISNLNDMPVLLEKGDRPAYIELYNCICGDFITGIDETRRGDGAFGSTGK